MSAIAGVFYRDGQTVDRGDLTRMAVVQAHRGPDGSGIWMQDAVGLAHRMLRTTCESIREQLPITDEAAGVVLTADARLDNRDDLIRAFGLVDHPGYLVSDGELILRAYQRWGDECPAHLLGDFAFSIWDARQQRLLCARDPIGVRALYYYCHETMFAFATEIKGLLSLPGVPRSLNKMRVAEYLLPSFEDRSITFYDGISRLPAAHVLVVDRDAMRVYPYWQLDMSQTVRLGSDREYAECFRDLLSEAVHCRLRSAYPIGSTLSGGLDSSSIACVAADRLGAEERGPLHTFSAIFPGLPAPELSVIDEREYIQAVLDLGGFQPHFVHADWLSPLVRIGGSIWHCDEPFMAPNLYMHWAMYGAARQCTVRVFLDGIDGDTTVSHGLGYLRELAASVRWWRLLKEVNALASTVNASYTPRRILWEYALQPFISDLSFLARRLSARQSEADWHGDSLVNLDFGRRVGLREHLESLDTSHRAPVRTERAMHRNGLMSSLIPYTLELADQAAGVFGLEARYPFCDRRLIEFCLALPGDQKLCGGWTRSVMRRAMTGILPHAVQWRTQKANLGPNFKRQLLHRERETLDRIILIDTEIISEYVDVPALREAYRRFASSGGTSDDAINLYMVTVLALWLENSGL